MIFVRWKQLVELRPHHAIALAGGVFEPRPIDDGHLTVSVFYQSRLLQGVGCCRYAGALAAEQHCQELMGNWEGIGSCTVMRNQ